MTDTNTPDGSPRITPEMIAAAEQLIGLTFTDAEREQMGTLLSTRRDQYAALRDMPLANHDGLALLFQPDVTPPPPVTVPRSYPMSAQPPVARPASLEDIAFYPVTQLAELVRTRQVSAVELAQMYLDRLRRYDPILHCVVTFTEDLAMQQAEQADVEIMRGHYRGPLHGIPWGAKDILATKHYPTTWGAAPYKDQIIDTDAAVVNRLAEAGAVLVAKLTTGALAYGDIWFGGKTRNPWDTNEGSSGSSAGPAAATAAGLVGFAIGSETLGSIVSPGTRCGVTGLRPTFGRVSRAGSMTLSWSLDKLGPMCRTVEDCALVFSAIYGLDQDDPTTYARPFHPFQWNPALDPRTLRIGYVESLFHAAAEDDDARAQQVNDRAALDVLREQGFTLTPVKLPDTDLTPLFIIVVSEAAASFDEITRADLDDLMAWQDDEAWPNLFRAARFIPAIEYIQANRVRLQLMRALAALMDDIDVLVTPSFGGNVLILTNLTGHPGVVVPNGFTGRGTPTSLSFIGGLDCEAETLAVAKAYQDATDFHRQYPLLDG